MSDPRFSIEDLSRLKTIDRCLAHADRRGITATRTLSGKQVLFLRELVERLTYRVEDSAWVQPPDVATPDGYAPESSSRSDPIAAASPAPPDPPAPLYITNGHTPVSACAFELPREIVNDSQRTVSADPPEEAPPQT